ncbi:hypothetical protein [Stakelama tenebrarum]|uniref:Uncharacterized protein n=1 Tax=Stakelama tenebrarum TaxID=2711215 RepID=A0A6G6Y518_9SPHN|nr:hypothetical protein [Sphingosinithalassobacter tenebrarum]QIG80000.1 hypothetical protein G5C33_09570 [Sphingosinithalassobacter tenebrarum]
MTLDPARLFDVGIMITGAAVIPAFFFGRGHWMRHALLLYWVASAAVTMADVSRSTHVLTYATINIVIFAIGLVRFTTDRANHRAWRVGIISLATMPAHLTYSATMGQGDWGLYALFVNGCMLAQCIVAGGWLDGMGQRVSSFRRRFRGVRRMGDRGR